MKVIQIDFDETIHAAYKGMQKLIPEYEPTLFKTYRYNTDLLGKYDIESWNSLKNKILDAWRNPSVLSKDYLFPDNILSHLNRISKEGYQIIIRSVCYCVENAEKKKEILKPCLNSETSTPILFEPIIGKEKPQIKCDYYIDDFMENLEKYNPKDTRLFLIDRPHNQEIWNPQFDYSVVTRVKDAVEALELIKKEDL